MTEVERRTIISKIQKEILEKESLNKKYDELKTLTENPVVIKYLNLLSEISRITSDIAWYRSIVTGTLNDSLEERIKFGFRSANFSCKHEIWLYAGSYYKYTNFKYEEDYERRNSEDIGDSLHEFSYNKYCCLECRKEIKISKSDWQNFEASHHVLKTQNQNVNLCAKVEYYINLFYQFLYENPLEGARQKLIE